MVEYDTLIICQIRLSFKISYILLQANKTVQNDIFALLGANECFIDVFSRHSDSI